MKPTQSKGDLRDLCRLLGELTLRGWRVEVLRRFRQEGLARRLSTLFEDELGGALEVLHGALCREEAEAIAAEYTRLMVASGAPGEKSRLLVPPWEDCYSGDGSREVLGAQSRAVLQAYAAARLGFDGMTREPADHIGLELCFTASLLEEEERGERDDSARLAFAAAHLRRFSLAFGEALRDAAREGVWQETGRTLALLPGVL